MIESESVYKEAITVWFGAQLAHNILPENHEIKPIFVSHINERDIHPFVRPIYQALYKQNLLTGHWAELIHIILKCKCVRKQKIGNVYKSVYETLTGKSVNENVFNLLPYEEQELWENAYIESDEVNSDPRKTAEHTKECLKINLRLIEFCHTFDIKIPDLNQTEYFEQLDLKDLLKRQESVKNAVPLRKEIKKAIADLEESLGDDLKFIDTCKEHSEISFPQEKITRKVVYKDSEAKDSQDKDSEGVFDNCDKPEDSHVKFRGNTTEFEYTPLNNGSSVTLETDPCYRPSPVNPYFQQRTTFRKPAPKYASSPNVKTQQPSDMTETVNCSVKMATNIRLIDFLPTKYNPNKLECDPEAHILGFRDYLSAQLNEANLDDVELSEQKLDMFKFTCLGEARLWYESNKPFDGINDLEEKFLKEYSPGLQSTTTAAKSFSELEYNPKTKLTSFINKIMRLNRCLGYADHVLRDRLMSAVPADIRRLAKISKPQTFRETIQAIKSVLEDQSSDTNNVAIVSNDTMTDSIQDISLSIDNMKKDINKISNRVNKNEYQRGNFNVRPNRGFRSFQSNRGFRGRGQSNGQQRQHHRQEERPTQQNFTSFNQRGRGQFHARPQLDRSRIRCFNCNKIGHFQNECWSRRSNAGFQKNYQQKTNQKQ
jgi:hypothetical protein